MKRLHKLYWLGLFISLAAMAQEAPQAEPVYGGYVEEMYAAPLSATTTRIYATTMSANSMFYADVANVTTSPVFGGWTTVPDLDWDDDYGALRCFASDAHSGFVFAGLQTGGLIAASPSAGSLYTVDLPMIEAVQARNGYLFYQVIEGPDQKMYYASIDAAGVVSTPAAVTIASGSWNPRFPIQIVISPYDQYVYVFVPDVPPLLYKSSDTYDAFTPTTTFTALSTSDLAATGYEYGVFTVAPDGHLYAGSYWGHSSNFETRISISVDDGTSWSTAIVPADAGRGDMRVSGDSTSYMIYYSRIMSEDKGANWSEHGGADGTIAADPNNMNIAYVRTDWAVGMYDHSAGSITQINDGLLAVQVNDFAMDTSKSTAWVASKSGIWHVTGYGTSSVVWTDPIWPNYDSTPYDVVSCTATADTAYMGNTSGRVFRYESASGAVDDPNSYQNLFEATQDSGFPYWTWTYGTRVSAIAIDEAHGSERILVGLYDEEDWDETDDSLGGVFVGENTGSGPWTWTQITGGDFPATGVDVNDIVVVEESGNTVAYVGVEYNTSYSTVNGVYRCEESGGSWAVTSDLFLSASYPISATIYDLYVSDNDTIFACGTDVSGTTVRAYKKAIGDTYWISLTSSGLTAPNAARAIAYDEVNHDLYLAVENTIYVLYAGASSWAAYYDYPVGTDIQFIYYDDLLVGTDVGLYGHQTAVGINPIAGVLPKDYQLEQNYPNPFNPSTVIEYTLPISGRVDVQIFDVRGRAVRQLVNMNQTAGVHSVTFQAGDLPSGLYIYTLRGADVNLSRKMLLMK